MRIEPIIAIQLLVFLVPAWRLHRVLLRRCLAGGSPWLTSLGFLSWVVLAPYGLLYLLAPIFNWLFMTHPILGGGTWDVGLALALWGGMALSYLAAIAIGVPGVIKFFWAIPDREKEHVC